jgi:hypothetical protein
MEKRVCFRAGKPPTGLHLDVQKDKRLIQKLMVDDKRCYLFGRNSQLNDFCIDHQSCSRVHSALVYHKHLNRAFLVDLGSSECTNGSGEVSSSLVQYISCPFQPMARSSETSASRATSPLPSRSTANSTLVPRRAFISSGRGLRRARGQSWMSWKSRPGMSRQPCWVRHV